MNPHHKRPLQEIFSKMRAKMSRVYNEELSRVAFFGEPTQEQKQKAYAAMDACGMDLLKKIDHKNHPEWNLKLK